MKIFMFAIGAIGVGLIAENAPAQFSQNVQPVFTVTPTSGMGTIQNPNALTLTPLSNGFSVSGQLLITIPAGPVSGVLATWTVERRIDTNYSAAGLMTQTVLTGYSTPPTGVVGNSSGTVSTTWNFVPSSALIGGSTSTVPMTLVNGFDSPAWNGLTATSSSFTYNSFVSPAVMRQTFTLNGNYISGSGGTWIVDVPVDSTVLPEPTSVATFFLATSQLLRRRRNEQGRPQPRA